jgi:hypothetical protein
MIKYFCDHCKKEIEGTPHLFNRSWSICDTLELCNECLNLYHKGKENIDKEMELLRIEYHKKAKEIENKILGELK